MTPDEWELVRIVAPHFVAGVVLKGGTVVEAAPIVKYMRGWSGTEVARYAERKRWTARPCAS